MVDTVLGLIAEDTGQPVERIFDDSLHDHWYTAAEARDYGFIDEIVDSFGQVMPTRKHRIGLTGQTQAPGRSPQRPSAGDQPPTAQFGAPPARPCEAPAREAD